VCGILTFRHWISHKCTGFRYLGRWMSHICWISRITIFRRTDFINMFTFGNSNNACNRLHEIRHHLQNRKYITYCTVVREDWAMTTGNMYRKFREVWTCGLWDTLADRYGDRETGIQTHYRNTSQPNRDVVNTGVQILQTGDSSDPRHFSINSELSERHIGTGANMSRHSSNDVLQKSTGDSIIHTVAFPS